MNRKILFVFASMLVLALFVFPVMAVKPTETPVTYFRKVEITLPIVGGSSGESGVYIIKNSTRTGSIYEGTDMSGTKLFNFIQYGSNEMNMAQGRATWHFYMVWTKTNDPESGFKGKLNGDAFSPPEGLGLGWHTVSGVLQGYGDCAGQKLVVEMARTPPDDALITGLLYD